MKLLILLFWALLIWASSHTPQAAGFIDAVRNGNLLRQNSEAGGENAVAVWSQAAAADKDGLLEAIREEAERTRIPAVNAKLDRVWKAIPGLNGREIDVEKSYRLASQFPSGTPVHYVYRELPPEVSLDNLGAQPIYRGNPGKRMISLMINVAWGDEYLVKMLQTLQEQNVHATFFFDGTWLSTHLETAQAIKAAGHELSNHAYSHKNMSTLSRGRAQQEISKTEQLLKQIGVENKLFAPPSGDFDQETVEIAHEMKLRTILWTIDTVDWKRPRPEDVLAKVSAKLEPGAMILMHPTISSMMALEGIIKESKKRGYALGTVSELISPERVPELETSLGK
jgi:probable sporulation protein (polysaccharide deacetylase family)